MIHLVTDGMDLSDPSDIAAVNNAIHDALCTLHSKPLSGQALLKVHIGEPKCITRMRPAYMEGSSRFLRSRGISSITAGDTTVAYTGDRGHKQNPPDNVNAYRDMARDHGWAPDGPARVPFTILDRPISCRPDSFTFTGEEQKNIIGGIQRFTDFYPAAGFLAADFIVNHAHLTLHGLAGVAGCVKSIAMGCSALKGKYMMHQSLIPHFDEDICKGCALCVKSCPEGALCIAEGAVVPEVNCELCIGCGECVSICKNKAVVLHEADITDWKRGEETLPLRMADYTLGLMNGKWDSCIHVLHMYSVTELCDCVDQKQTPMVGDMGFLISKNPFAVDKAAGEMLTEAVNASGADIPASKLNTAHASADYVRDAYGIISDVPATKITLSS
jgi:ferredoxin